MATDADVRIERLEGLIQGYRSTQVVYVMAKLGVADELAFGPATANELAERLPVPAEPLARFLRLAAQYELVAEVPAGRFAITELGAQLRTEAKGSLRTVALMIGAEHYAAWGSLLYTVQTGMPAFDKVFGSPFFDYLAAHPDVQTIFDAAMSAGVEDYFAALGDTYDFSRARLLVDVGGGNGSLSAIILKRHPHLEAVIYDQPQVLEAAERYLSDAGVRDRCRLETGNFFESVPEGGDVYLLSNIVHDWDDERSLPILKHCRAAMNAEGAVLLVEVVMPEHGTLSGAATNDVNMMVLLPGRERTRQQFESLLHAADLRLEKVTSLSHAESVIEARPA